MQSTSNWEPTIRRFESLDRRHPPSEGVSLFVGASTIRMWTSLPDDFPFAVSLNRGFGGAQLPDVLAYLDRIVFAYAPRVTVINAGENDLAQGRDVTSICRDSDRFMEAIERQWPGHDLCFIGIKPSPARLGFREAMLAINHHLAARCSQQGSWHYVNVFDPMLLPSDEPDVTLFQTDGVHLSAAGYGVWRDALHPILRAIVCSEPLTD